MLACPGECGSQRHLYAWDGDYTKVLKKQLPSGGSDGKESACNVGDLGSIPELRRSPGGEGMANHSSILAWRITMDRGAWQATVHGVAKSWA